jgi:DNA invertase Pin-like site-specific DNA recombinase
MKVFYSRTSTPEQNEARQLENTDSFDYVLIDKCSGSIPLWERPQGSQIKKLIVSGKLKHLEIHSIDRLGRNTLDVLHVWEHLTKEGVTVVCRNPNMRNLDDEGKPDKFSQLLISLLSLMSSFERDMIRQRQLEGIRLRKAKNLYAGRQIGTKESPEKFLSKPKSKKIKEYLDKGTYTYEEIRKILNCSPSTIQKVKKMTMKSNEHLPPN